MLSVILSQELLLEPPHSSVLLRSLAAVAVVAAVAGCRTGAARVPAVRTTAVTAAMVMTA